MARGFASDWVAPLNLYAEALSPHVEVIVGLDEVMRVGSQDGFRSPERPNHVIKSPHTPPHSQSEEWRGVRD